VLTVIMAASAMEVAGGVDFLVGGRAHHSQKPEAGTLVAPPGDLWLHVRSARATSCILLPVIYEVAHESGIRPERPMAIATLASQQAVTASPVSAARPP
jgi:anaerobic C4-dicarboxylate transporter DcuA